MKLNDFIISNFNGGLVTNKSDLEMNKNEFKNTLNLDLEDTGKAKRRRGSRLFGAVDSSTTCNGIIDESTAISLLTSNAPFFSHVFIDRASNATLYRLVGTYTTVAAAAGATTITVGNTGEFDQTSGATIEVGGDVITVTGGTATTFTVTGATVLQAIPAYTPVHQIRTSDAGATGMDTTAGAYFAILNNLLFVNGRVGSATWNGSSISAVSDADEPAGIFATNYRDRIYVAGSGASDGSGTRNGALNRVSFSDAGDATSWTLTNYFDVEDERGEPITGFKEASDHLVIFKYNSVHTYNEVQLTQSLWNVGAYNHKVIQKIDNNILTFCPAGVFITNGFSAKKISEPIEKYTRLFRPQFDTTNRVVVNCFSGQFEGKYYLYLGDIPLDGTISDLVLVYDTENKNWTVHDSYTDFTHFGSFKTFSQGYGYNATRGGRTVQFGESLFAGGTGAYYRLFDGRFYDNGKLGDGVTSRTLRGGDIIPNMISNSTGNPISTVLETKFYEVGNPGSWKRFGGLKLQVDEGEFAVSYRLDLGSKNTDWISLGTFTPNSMRKSLPTKNNEGFRISLKITSNTKDTISKLSGIFLTELESIDKRK